MIILPLDPHLVDASVNFEDLGYLHFFLYLHLLVATVAFLDLGYLQLLSSTFGGRQSYFEDLGYLQTLKI